MLEPGSRLRTALVAGTQRSLSLAGALALPHAAVAIAKAFDFSGLLGLALVATLLFAIPITIIIPAQTPAWAARSPAPVAEVAYLIVATMVGVLGLLLLTLLAGASEDFYCAPQVPWRIEIAAFGGLALGMFETMLQRRGRLSTLGPALYLAFFWIAPWYGFFHAPAFLAQLIFYPCEEAALETMALSVVAMAMTYIIGRRLAVWLFAP